MYLPNKSSLYHRCIGYLIDKDAIEIQRFAGQSGLVFLEFPPGSPLARCVSWRVVAMAMSSKDRSVPRFAAHRLAVVVHNLSTIAN